MHEQPCCTVCGLLADWYDPWQEAEVWYCGKHVPRPVRDYLRAHDVARTAYAHVDHVLHLELPAEARRVLGAIRPPLQRATGTEAPTVSFGRHDEHVVIDRVSEEHGGSWCATVAGRVLGSYPSYLAALEGALSDAADQLHQAWSLVLEQEEAADD